jgi:hypothetical protein
VILLRTAGKLLRPSAAEIGVDVPEFWGMAGPPDGAPRALPSDERDPPPVRAAAPLATPHPAA